MHRLVPLVSFSATLACSSPAPAVQSSAGSTPPGTTATVGTTVDAARTSAAESPSTDDDAELDPRFPAGRGATLVTDQLQQAFRDPVVRDVARPFAERIAAASQLLREPGTTDGTAHVWYGVFGKNVAGPFGCRELRIADGRPMLEGPTDHKHCGLPYSRVAPGEFYIGPGARRTSVRLQSELEIQRVAPSVATATKRLGAPDETSDTASVWLGVGPRDDAAPLTCWALRVGKDATLDKVDLSECAITWPPPPAAFEPGPTYPRVAVAPLLTHCRARCKATEICMLDRRVAKAASIVVHDDGSLSARYTDGRAAELEIVPSCAAIPPACAKPSGSCWWKGPADAKRAPGAPSAPNPGPCPPDTHTGHSSKDAEGDAPAHVMCFSRLKR